MPVVRGKDPVNARAVAHPRPEHLERFVYTMASAAKRKAASAADRPAGRLMRVLPAGRSSPRSHRPSLSRDVRNGGRSG